MTLPIGTASVSALIIFALTARPVEAQFRDIIGNPEISVGIEYPPQIPLSTKRIAFGPISGQCAETIVDRLSGSFTGRGTEVLDRQNMHEILREQKFNLSSFVDEAAAVELGKLLGPTTMVFVRVDTCRTELKQTYRDVNTYDRNKPAVRYYKQTRTGYLRGSIRVVDLQSGKVLGSPSLNETVVKSNEAERATPEPPDEQMVLDLLLDEAVRSSERLFFKWSATRSVLFFDDKKCDLKSAHQLLKSGNVNAAFDLSVRNLETCKSTPKVDDRTLAHAYYNAGILHGLRNEHVKALELLFEAQKLRPGDVTSRAIATVREDQAAQEAIKQQEKRVQAEIAQEVKKEEQRAKEIEARKPKPLAPAELLSMREAGLSEEIIAARIKKEGKPMELSTEELVQLKRAGFTDAMLKVLMDPSVEYVIPPPAPVGPAVVKPPPAPVRTAQPKPTARAGSNRQ